MGEFKNRDVGYDADFDKIQKLNKELTGIDKEFINNRKKIEKAKKQIEIIKNIADSIDINELSVKDASYYKKGIKDLREAQEYFENENFMKEVVGSVKLKELHLLLDYFSDLHGKSGNA